MPSVSREQLRRIARWPSRFAPRLSELHSPPPDANADLAEVADLTEVSRDAEAHITRATMSARAFVSLAGRCPELRHVRLIGAAMIFDEVVASPRFAGLEALSLAGCRIGDAGVELMAGDLTPPAPLSEAERGEPAGAPAQLSHGFSLSRLGSPLSASERGAGGVRSLLALDLSHNALTVAALYSLAGHVPKLEWLNLAGNFLEPPDFAILSDFAAFPSLRRVVGWPLR